MTVESLVQSFEAAELPPGGFRHREHVRVAWWYLRQYPWPVALERFRTGLRRFAEAQGAAQKYHETITTAYVLLINERLEDGGRDLDWEAFATRHADLLAWPPSILDRYYRPETLASDLARRAFVMPDRLEPGCSWRQARAT
jgi:hypothetical protein